MSKRYVIMDDISGEEIPEGQEYYDVEAYSKDGIGSWQYAQFKTMGHVTTFISMAHWDEVKVRKLIA